MAKRKKAKARKEDIRKAAVDLISEIGFHDCTTDKIAEKADISVGTIYNYFSNKQDILSYIFKVEKEKTADFFEKLLEKDLSADQKIKIFLNNHFNKICENHKKAKLLHDESNRPAKGVPKEIYDYVQLIRKYLKKLLEEGQNEGIIRDNINLEMTSAIIMGAVNSIVLMGHVEKGKFKLICDSAPEEILNILNKGIFEKN